jgi:hypothetical protein
MNGKKLIIGSIGGTFSGIAINYLGSLRFCVVNVKVSKNGKCQKA